MLAAIARDGADRLIDAQEAPVRRDLRNPDCGMLIGRRPTLFLLEGMQTRLFERGGRAFSLGDIDKTIDRADHIAFGIAQRIDIERHRHAHAVHAFDDTLDIARRLSGRQHFSQFRPLQRRAIDIEKPRGRGELVVRLSRSRFPAPNFHGAAVVLEDRALGVANKSRDRQHVENAVRGTQHRAQRRGFSPCGGPTVVVRIKHPPSLRAWAADSPRTPAQRSGRLAICQWFRLACAGPVGGRRTNEAYGAAAG